MNRFFQVKHYTVEKSMMPISDWLNNTNNSEAVAQDKIEEMRREIRENEANGFYGSRNNILLFGKEIDFKDICRQGKKFSDNLMKDICDLEPFLRIIHKYNTRG